MLESLVNILLQHNTKHTNKKPLSFNCNGYVLLTEIYTICNLYIFTVFLIPINS